MNNKKRIAWNTGATSIAIHTYYFAWLHFGIAMILFLRYVFRVIHKTEKACCTAVIRATHLITAAIAYSSTWVRGDHFIREKLLLPYAILHKLTFCILGCPRKNWKFLSNDDVIMWETSTPTVTFTLMQMARK